MYAPSMMMFSTFGSHLQSHFRYRHLYNGDVVSSDLRFYDGTVDE